MDRMEAIDRRWAVRSFTAAPVDPAILRSLMDAAVQAPGRHAPHIDWIDASD